MLHAWRRLRNVARRAAKACHACNSASKQTRLRSRVQHTSTRPITEPKRFCLASSRRCIEAKAFSASSEASLAANCSCLARVCTDSNCLWAEFFSWEANSEREAWSNSDRLRRSCKTLSRVCNVPASCLDIADSASWSSSARLSRSVAACSCDCNEAVALSACWCAATADAKALSTCCCAAALSRSIWTWSAFNSARNLLPVRSAAADIEACSNSAWAAPSSADLK
mmetsp:Transcript_55156/g.109606  ORF Transcript_55156/g.109606 Transcript_55156/m.109606 type:complete len:226 (-) Transcript_55156:338-1015(-)